MDEVDEVIDTILSLIIVGLFLPFTVGVAVLFLSGNFAGFGTPIEKTALSTDSEIVVEHIDVSKEEVLLGLVVADEFMYPCNVMDIHGQKFVIDVNFVRNRNDNLIKAYSKLKPTTKPQNIYPIADSSGITEWRVEDK